MPRPYGGPSEKELRRLYLDEKLSTRAIGARFGVTHMTIKRWLRQAGIPRRPTGSPQGLAARGIEAPSPFELWTMLHAEHLGYRGVAERYGVHLSAVRHWAMKAGIQRPTIWQTRRSGRVPQPPTPEEIRTSYAAGMSLKRIGEAYGLSGGTIKNLCTQYRIDVRPNGWQQGKRWSCADGHEVRSVYEQRVDDWLSEHGIDHEPDPKLPGDNLYRGDFRIADLYVEIWGVAGSSTYEARKRAKLKLYRDRALPLLQLPAWTFAAKYKGLWARRLAVAVGLPGSTVRVCTASDQLPFNATVAR